MKNFLDLLAIEEPYLHIIIESIDKTTEIRWPLLQNLDLSHRDVRSVKVDGMEIIDFGYMKDGTWNMCLDEPFYHWRHRVTGQGWLLEPVKSLVRGSSDI